MRSAFLGSMSAQFSSMVSHAGLRGADHVGAGQNIELPRPRQVTDIDAKRARRIGDIDVPVVATAVNIDVAHNGFGVTGSIMAADVQNPENGLGSMPFLPQGRL